MDVWDAMCRTIMSAGSRRGAMMATLRCDHPDIEAFIDAKRDAGRLRIFNLSVLVTDAFMDGGEGRRRLGAGVRRHGLSHASRRARCGTRIMRATYDYAEPGVIFIDRINRRNNLHYCETIHATNPCGEQPLPPYGACLLGSINLAKLVQRSVRRRRRVSIWSALARSDARRPCACWTTSSTSRAFRCRSRRRKRKAKRRIGLGVTGLADALIFCGVRYGSPESVALTASWLAALQRRRLSRLGRHRRARRAPSRCSTATRYLARRDDPGAAARTCATAIAPHGIRNALLTSIAPTGTISLFADNVSSRHRAGVRLQLHAQRAAARRQPQREEEVEDYAYRACSAG